MSFPEIDSTRLAAEGLLRGSERQPIVGIVVHHGFRELALRLADRREAPISSLPGFENDLPGALFVFGRLSGVEVVLLDPNGSEEGDTAEFLDDRPIRILAALGVSVVVLTGPTRAVGTDLAPGEIVRLVEIEESASRQFEGGERTWFDPALGELMEISATQVGLPLREGVIRAFPSENGSVLAAASATDQVVTGRWFVRGFRILGGRHVRVVAIALIVGGKKESNGTSDSMARLGDLLDGFVDAVSRRPSVLVRFPGIGSAPAKY